MMPLDLETMLKLFSFDVPHTSLEVVFFCISPFMIMIAISIWTKLPNEGKAIITGIFAALGGAFILVGLFGGKKR